MTTKCSVCYLIELSTLKGISLGQLGEIGIWTVYGLRQCYHATVKFLPCDNSNMVRRISKFLGDTFGSNWMKCLELEWLGKKKKKEGESNGTI